MRALQLVLKKKWFDMIADGIKHEEYREIKPFWMKRLYYMLACDADGGYDRLTMTEGEARNVIEHLEEDLHYGNIEPRPFDGVMFYLGYAKDRPKMYVPIERITIGTGNPEWGAEPGKKYFVIKLKQS